MRSFQYFAHKTSLAIDYKNAKLASFYAHEVESILEEVKKIETFDDHPIAEHAISILEPAFVNLENAIKSKKWNKASARFDDLISACNECHRTTEHGYVKIKRQIDNPYMQSFAP